MSTESFWIMRSMGQLFGVMLALFLGLGLRRGNEGKQQECGA